MAIVITQPIFLKIYSENIAWKKCTTHDWLFQQLRLIIKWFVSAVHRLDRKMVSSAFYSHEMEAELKERNLDWAFVGKLEDARDNFMEYIESQRRLENNAHPTENCSKMCKEGGNVTINEKYSDMNHRGVVWHFEEKGMEHYFT